ncbi:unnamed protein product [Wuchereria bancrofti]|uniref:Uncharacterized protein n=1 Tax=Wuchereria bancrofti TaxID=6293 RepID=A0A3P7ELI8_WUCBA|nr:unnamed protein product [Wuchereria bancrofti]
MTKKKEGSAFIFLVMQPGFYDIETEMCTPELDDVKEYIPPEIEKNIVEKRPVPNFFLNFLNSYSIKLFQNN